MSGLNRGKGALMRSLFLTLVQSAAASYLTAEYVLVLCHYSCSNDAACPLAECAVITTTQLPSFILMDKYLFRDFCS